MTPVRGLRDPSAQGTLASWDLSHTPTVRESILEDFFLDFDHPLRIIIHIFLDTLTKRVAPVPLLLYWLINLDVCVATIVGEPACNKYVRLVR